MTHSIHTAQPALSSGRDRRANRWTIGHALVGLSLAALTGLSGCASTAVGDPDPVTPIPVASAAPGGAATSGNGSGTAQ